MSFNQRDMWENQVELLTRHCQSLTQQVEELENRLRYFEGVVATLLVALKEGGILVDSSDASEGVAEYEF
jgi:fructose-1,6-bisphosphatase